MIEAPGRGLTLRGVLFDRQGPAEVVRALQEAGAGGRVDRRLRAVPTRLREAAREEALRAIARVLDIGLVDVLAGAWASWEELAAPARRSLDVPGVTEIVEIVDHRISSSHRPRVDVVLDGRRIGQIALAIDAAIEVHALRAVVANGRVTALRSGRADVEAVLSVEGMEVARAGRAVELSFEVGLGAGIALAGSPGLLVLPEEPAGEPTIVV